MPTKSTTTIGIPFWPSAVNNIKWSADNLIAVGGGESLAILVPRLGTKGPNNLPWDNILHRVSYFDYDEIPMLEALSSSNWSLGEEQSLRHITELEWSAPGLGKFSTCLLAVLHSNHVLTLWECTGRPEIKDDWRRCIIVNHAVQKYYAGLDDELNDPSEDQARAKHEKERVRQRITAFAWSPLLRKHDEPLVPGLDEYLNCGTQYLAVSTEGGHVLILSVSSPFDQLEVPRKERNVTVVQSFPAAPTVNATPESYSNGSGGLDPSFRRSAASHLAWSDWASGQDGQRPADDSQLAFIAEGRLFATRVLATDADDEQIQFQCTAWHEIALPQAPDLKGPLRFLARTSTAVLFADDSVLQVDTVLGWSKSHHLDGRWDEPSAVIVATSEEDQQSLHISSHLSSSTAETTRLTLHLEDREGKTETSWQYALQESRANFSVTHDLAGNVQERTWGLTASPLEDLIAVCVSLLPSDSPAHIIQSNQKSEVLITTEWNSGQSPWPTRGFQAAPESLSAETILYSIRQFIARGGILEAGQNSKQAYLSAALQSLGLEQLVITQGSSAVPTEAIEAVPSTDFTRKGLDLCLRYLRGRVYYDAVMLHDRLSRLVAIAVQESPKLQLSKQAYAVYMSIVLSLPPAVLSSGGPLSTRIASAIKSVQCKLADQPSNVPPVDFTEQCSVCTQPIHLESLRWSRCAEGHQFPRCNLTFLSILEPGLSKSCRICGTQSLNEYVLPEMSTFTPSNDTDDGKKLSIEPQVSLARLLFAACDKCIFCGGKFVA